MLNDGWKMGQLLTAIAQSCHVCRHFDEPQALLVWLKHAFQRLVLLSYPESQHINSWWAGGYGEVVGLLCFQR